MSQRSVLSLLLLQEELSPWSTAFLEKHGRKPGMQDVVATGERGLAGWLAGWSQQEYAAACWAV